jgi:hypothetical protein
MAPPRAASAHKQPVDRSFRLGGISSPLMRWALFQQVMQKLAVVREIDPHRDAAVYAERLLGLHPELFESIDGGPESVRARMAALTIARDHLREVMRLPDYVDELERSLAVMTMSAGSRLVRVTALAYILCTHEHREGLPIGYGLLDDCIAVRGAVLATPGRLPPGSLGRMMVTELLRIRYLGLALPREVLSQTEAALTSSAELAARARGLPNQTLEHAILQVIRQPPTRFPAELALPEPTEPIEVETIMHLLSAKLVELNGETMLFAFADGSQIRREADGVLHDA